MKRILAMLMVLCMLLCACGKDEEVAETNQSEVIEESSEEVTEESKAEEVSQKTEESSEVVEGQEEVIRHPLTGEVLEEPWKGTAAAITINNSPDALPHYGISQADIFYEIETEGSVTRMFAIFTDLEEVGTIGPVRSVRTYFNNVAASYDAPVFHCGGNDFSLNGHYDINGNVVPNWKHVDETSNSQYFFRDTDRYNYQGYAWEHTLFTNGENMAEALVDKGFDKEEELSVGLKFAEDPQLDGDSASEVLITFKGGKTYTMTYNSDTGLYEGAEYGAEHIDAGSGEVMSYRNVLVIYTTQYYEVYQGYGLAFYDLIGSGEGHFACDGKIIPIKWSRESIDEPFVYTMEDGTPLTLGVGNSYIGIVSDTRTVEYQ